MIRPALIFDCDGVLADTERDGHLIAFNQTFAELGYPFRWSAEEYKELLKIGGGKERLLAYAHQHHEFDLFHGEGPDQVLRDVHSRKSALYLELVEAGALPGRPGIQRIIHTALEAGWQVAVASTSAYRSVEAVLRSVVKLADFTRVSGIFAGDIVPAKKPAPDVYLLAARELGCEPDEIVVFEDSESGAKAASEASFRHIVSVSYFTRDDGFPNASSILSDLGDPGRPAHVLGGADILNPFTGLVDLGSLEAVLAMPRPDPGRA